MCISATWLASDYYPGHSGVSVREAPSPLILGDPGADSGGKRKSKRGGKSEDAEDASLDSTEYYIFNKWTLSRSLKWNRKGTIEKKDCDYETGSL